MDDALNNKMPPTQKRAFKMEVEEASFPRIGTTQSKIILYLGLKIVADFFGEND